LTFRREYAFLPPRTTKLQPARNIVQSADVAIAAPRGFAMAGFSGTAGFAPRRQAEREPVAGDCPECGASALQSYKVLSNGGWHSVVKCQSCLCSVSRDPWNRLGHVDRDAADRVINPGVR
jgi:hypothetical protein